MEEPIFVLSAGQRLGQSAFLAIERWFNAAFGERLNPLYYLGAIAYFALLVVIASGLYVYAFYRTGVEITYASVEAVTHDPWYIGGLMRSLHRYGSDALVALMLLHLVRHFVFDRYRGFRAFSWITGIAVLWLVYVSGINGFMLPWDRLAQYVATATAEWFDALPVFRGTLVRNFILPENITDRFFSLLSFLHIGIPLALVAALWVHTQRVPRAHVLPPRGLAIGFTAALVVLSLAKPIESQGPADPASTATSLAFDWFYLPVYPLIYRWSPLAVWGLVGGATLVMLLAPWLPPPRRRRGEPFQFVIQPLEAALTVREGETLLDAGLRQGIALPFDCRNGGCGECKATLLHGELDWGTYQRSALSDAERAQGKVLLCCATALSDIAIECERAVGEAGGKEHARRYRATVQRMERLAPEVMLIELRLQGGERMRFAAGQYINVLLAGGVRRAYSFTARSGETDLITLHVRRIPGGLFTTHVFERMSAGDALEIEGPLGALAWHEPSERPVILVAGATGFAPVKSLLEEAFARGIGRPLFLYWGVRRQHDLYLHALVEGWAKEHPNFQYVPVLSEPQPADDWRGRTGLVHEAILADFPSLAGYEVYACGSMKMVEAAKPAFIAAGLSDEACYLDAFLPAGSSSPAASAQKN